MKIVMTSYRVVTLGAVMVVVVVYFFWFYFHAKAQ